MTTSEIKSEARKKLSLNMHQAIIAYTIQFAVYVTLIALVAIACVCLLTIHKWAAVVMICYGVVLLFVAIICSHMLTYAMIDYYMATYKCKKYDVRRLAAALAQNGIIKALKLNVLRLIKAFLLFLCLIVPGVIYWLRTSMANNLLAANPKMTASTALKASGKVMTGKTAAYFTLCMSFTGWVLLGIATLGLGFIFIEPYIGLTKTVFYKRNLQGDKSVYHYQPDSAGAQLRVPGEQPPPMPAEPVIPPIATFGDDDLQEMQAAMQDVDSNSQDVPEIAIKPIKTGTRPSLGRSGNNDPVFSSKSDSYDRQARKSYSYDDDQVQKTDDGDFVEIVKPLSTQEIQDSDVLNKNINKLFKSAPKTQIKKNYFQPVSNNRDNDFVTVETDVFDGFDRDETTNLGQGGDIAEESVTAPNINEDYDSVNGAEAELNRLLADLDSDFEEHENGNKTESPFASANAANAAWDNSGNRPLRQQPSRQDDGATQANAGESRADRIRREREERLKALERTTNK